MVSVKTAPSAMPVADDRGLLTVDLDVTSVRELNQSLHGDLAADGVSRVRIINTDGAHNIAVGLDAPVDVEIDGNAGYFIAGMNKQARVTINGNVGWSVAENMMSGMVRVRGFASECAGASGHGGMLVIEGDASSRCGISMKGCDIVVGGNVGHMSAFMAQAGHLVICGNAAAGLGDSLYEAVIYVRGTVKGLGADAQEEPMAESDYAKLAELLDKAGLDFDPKAFRRIASARKLYHWNADAEQDY